MKARLLLPAVLVLLVAALAPALAAAKPTGSGGHSVAVRAIAAGGVGGLPLRGARVVVRDGGGHVLARGRTGSEGVALLRSRRPLRGAIGVATSGGRAGGHRFGGHLLARVPRYRWPRTAYVDSVTTLAARYAAAHPHRSRRAVSRRVHRFLRLPGFYAIGLDGRTAVDFDGRRFLAAAGGGYDRFVGRLVRKMAKPKVHRSFRPRGVHLAGASASVNAAQAGDSLEAVTEAVAAGSGFFEVLDKTDAVLDFVDASLVLAGVGSGPSVEEMQEIESKLSEIEEELAQVRDAIGRVEEAGAKRGYSAVLREVKPASEAVTEAESIFDTGLRDAVQFHCGEPNSDARGCAEVEEMMTGKGGFVATIQEGGLGGPAGLNTFGGRIAGEAGPRGTSEEEGLAEAGSAMVTAGASHFYFDGEESQRVRAIATYWSARFAEATAMAPIAWGLEGDNGLTLSRAIEATRPTAQAMQGLTPQPLPAGTVVDMQHGLMWPTEVSGEGTSQPYSWYVENNPWRLEAGASRWVSVKSGVSVPALAANGAAAPPYENWDVAGPGHLGILVGTAPGGEALLEATGIDGEVVTPSYGGGVRGIPTGEEPGIPGHAAKGCSSLGASTCFWPIWAGDGAQVFDLNGGGESQAAYVAHANEEYEQTEYFGPVPWWGRFGGTLYGGAPVAKVPNLFFREVAPANCFYYPSVSGPTAGSPGCP